MKTFLMILISMTALRAAGPAGGNSPLAIPADAALVESNLYRSTDAQGITWVYRRTPFGVTRAAAKLVASPRLDAGSNVKAWDDGDSVRFERPGPFGVYRWRTRKTDLDALEQAVWTRQQTLTAGGQR